MSESGSRLLTLRSSIGLRLPVHCTALGKCLLAQLPPTTRRAGSAGAEPYEALTPRTITSWKALGASLERVRREGVALSHEEYEEGLDSIAVPLAWPERRRAGGGERVAAELAREGIGRRSSPASCARWWRRSRRSGRGCGRRMSTGTASRTGSTSPYDPRPPLRGRGRRGRVRDRRAARAGSRARCGSRSTASAWRCSSAGRWRAAPAAATAASCSPAWRPSTTTRASASGPSARRRSTRARSPRRRTCTRWRRTSASATR